MDGRDSSSSVQLAQCEEDASKSHGLTAAELALSYQQQVWKYAYALSRDKEAADDICQETYVRYITHQYSLNGHDLCCLLLTIARNVFITGYRKQRRDRLAKNDLRLMLISDLSESERGYQVTQEDLRAALLKLDDKDRHLITLRYEENLRMKEIAAIIGQTERTIRNRLNKCTKRLQATLAK